MIEKQFLQNFRKFATDVAKLSKTSAYCYVTYLHNACKLYGVENHLQSIAQSNNTSEQIALAEEICNTLDLATDSPACMLSTKDLNNSKVAAHMLLAFISGHKWTKSKGLTVTFTQIFSKKSLASIFRSRLRTQDRIYSFGAFPTNLLCKIATKHKVRNYWDTLIEKTKFVFNSKGDSICFEDIECVMLGSDNHAYFKKNDKIYTIFTKNTKTGCFVETKTNNVMNLSLDHDVPIENVLKQMLACNALPQMDKLGKDIVSFKLQYTATHPGAKNAMIIGEYEKFYDAKRLMLDEVALMQEFLNFLQALDLTVMDRA